MRIYNQIAAYFEQEQLHGQLALGDKKQQEAAARKLMQKYYLPNPVWKRIDALLDHHSSSVRYAVLEELSRAIRNPSGAIRHVAPLVKTLRGIERDAGRWRYYSYPEIGQALELLTIHYLRTKNGRGLQEICNDSDWKEKRVLDLWQKLKTDGEDIAPPLLVLTHGVKRTSITIGGQKKAARLILHLMEKGMDVGPAAYALVEAAAQSPMLARLTQTATIALQDEYYRQLDARGAPPPGYHSSSTYVHSPEKAVAHGVALYYLLQNNTRGVEALLRDRNPGIREGTLWAMHSAAERAQNILPLLPEVFERWIDREWEVASWAEKTLQELGRSGDILYLENAQQVLEGEYTAWHRKTQGERDPARMAENRNFQLRFIGLVRKIQKRTAELARKQDGALLAGETMPKPKKPGGGIYRSVQRLHT